MFSCVKLESKVSNKYAVKIIPKKLIDSNVKYLKLLNNEIKVMREIEHKNIVHLEDLLVDKKNYYIVMEYLRGGDLSKKLKVVS